MSHRQVVWGAGATVVLAAITGATINELHKGWPWWVAAAVITAAGAILAGRLASDGTSGSPQAGPGAVVAGRDIAGRIRTGGSSSSNVPSDGPGTGAGAVVAGRDIASTADVDTTGDTRQHGR